MLFSREFLKGDTGNEATVKWRQMCFSVLSVSMFACVWEHVCACVCLWNPGVGTWHLPEALLYLLRYLQQRGSCWLCQSGQPPPQAGVTYWVCLWVLGTQAPVFTGHSKGFIYGPWVVSQQILLYVTSLGAFKIINHESSPYSTKSETTKRCLLQKLWLVRKSKMVWETLPGPSPKGHPSIWSVSKMCLS